MHRRQEHATTVVSGGTGPGTAGKRHAEAPRTLVEFAMVQATMIMNRLPRARKGEKGLIVPLHRWLGIEPSSVLHVLKVWGCTAYALVQTGREKFDSKVVRLVHLGYDIARSAYILCALPHFKISYSAHVTFNEQEFPLRESYQPDSAPASMFEPAAGYLGQERVGGDWGRVLHTPGGPGESGATLGSGSDPFVRPTLVGRPGVSSWTAPVGAPNVVSETTPADELRVLSNTTFQGGTGALSRATRVGERLRVSETMATSSWTSGLDGRTLPQGAPGGGRLGPDGGRGPPSTGGGEQARDVAVRRSARGWKPSSGCLENIAHVSRELENEENELTRNDIGVHSGSAHGVGVVGEETTLEQTPWLRECSFAAQGVELSPRNHGEAMLMPHAQRVREAEISEFNSHVVNGTFGPELRDQDFASGPPLKAVWVYSKSKKDPGGFKARVVMQGFLMKQGLHFNDVHAAVPAVASFRAFMVGVASKGRNLEHWDVKTAFLTTKMDCDIDVTLPEAFNSDVALQQNARRGLTRHRVLKVIPGCPQGSRLWHDNLFAFLSS